MKILLRRKVQTFCILFVIAVLLLLRWLCVRNICNTILYSFSQTDDYITRFCLFISGVKTRTVKQDSYGPCHLQSISQNKVFTNYFSEINMACSNAISIRRRIPDTRLEECKLLKYPKNLPKTSVIIVLQNADMSILLRAVHSVLNRTPRDILEEILLVDDFSRTLKTDVLNLYIRRFSGKVKLLQNNGQGWKRPRSIAVGEAKGEVIVFLDPYCEVNSNWLPPLLTPIYRNHSVITVPIIDVIDHKTFEYRSLRSNNQHYQGIFDWSMMYKERKLSKAKLTKRKHNSEPYLSPTYYGEVFAINQEYFLYLGGYGSQIILWGDANLELSFRIWMCGGSIMWVPCSRIGHVFKDSSFFSSGNQDEKNTGIYSLVNRKRIAETWLDSKYKKYFYTRVPEAIALNRGDLREELALKEELHCNSFQWYLNNVATDVLYHYPAPPGNTHWGTLLNTATNTCMGKLSHGPPGLTSMLPCAEYDFNMVVRLNAAGQLGVGDKCLEGDERGIWIGICDRRRVDGPWEYSETTLTLFHLSLKKCLFYDPTIHHTFLKVCNKTDILYKWIFSSPKTIGSRITLSIRKEHFYVENYM